MLWFWLTGNRWEWTVEDSFGTRTITMKSILCALEKYSVENGRKFLSV